MQHLAQAAVEDSCPLLVTSWVTTYPIVLKERVGDALEKLELWHAAQVGHIAEVKLFSKLRDKDVFEHRNNIFVQVFHRYGSILAFGRLHRRRSRFFFFALEILRQDSFSRSCQVDSVQRFENRIILETQGDIGIVLDVSQRQAGVVVLERGITAHAWPDTHGHQVCLWKAISNFLE